MECGKGVHSALVLRGDLWRQCLLSLPCSVLFYLGGQSLQEVVASSCTACLARLKMLVQMSSSSVGSLPFLGLCKAAHRKKLGTCS